MSLISKQVLRNIQRAHLRQLAGQELPLQALEDIPRSGTAPNVQSFVKWIQDNPKSVRAAQDAKCSSKSPSSPNWDAVFLSLMESGALALRNKKLVVEASIAARAGDVDGAMNHLEASQKDINTVVSVNIFTCTMIWLDAGVSQADALDCTFIQVCDFSNVGPEGNFFHSGAFCGLFISKNTDKPFIGVAFKGSTTTQDYITNVDWRSIPPCPLQPEIAWGAEVHRGFYLGLFGKFTVESETTTPFDMLVEVLYTNNNKGSKIHFTGHSLGGAFCTLAYGEFLRRQADPPFVEFDLGDMYSYAAPRTCIQPFAAEFNKYSVAGSGKYVFRIVNKEDPVPTVPPPKWKDPGKYPFIHVGGGWKLLDEGPVKMDNEPPPVAALSLESDKDKPSYHQISDYFDTWQKSPHSGKEPEADVAN